MSKMIIKLKISPVHSCSGSQFHHYLLNAVHAVQLPGYLFFSLYPASSFSVDSAAYTIAPVSHPQLLLRYWCQWLMRITALCWSISTDYSLKILVKQAHFTIFTTLVFYLASLNLAEVCSKCTNCIYRHTLKAEH